MTRPDWWEPLCSRVTAARTEDFTRMVAPPEGGRSSAVLILFAEDKAGDPDVLLLQRAADMRNHAGQPAFPGGAADPGETDPVVTALREATEEVGLDPATVEVETLLPPLWIPVSRFLVTPVLAWWHKPHPVAPVDAAEVESVTRVRVADLANPANRVRVIHPSGWIGPAFSAGGMLIWGFTAGILSVLLEMGGWAQPWDATSQPVPLP
ncbi:MAG TPA: CoA pyrophosphatase [Micromonosporaceae bacterium]